MAGIRLTLRIVAAVLGFGAIVLGALSKGSVLPEDSKFEPILLIAAGSAAFIDAISGIAASRARRTGLELEISIEKTVIASLISISRVTGTDIILLGGCVFEIRRRRWWSRTKMLKRLVRSRLSDSPQESAITWRAGKGAIGEAWQRKKAVHRSWLAIARKHGEGQLSRAAFDRLPAKTQDGFEYEDFQTIVGKYSEILAVPILKNGRCIGVLAIDIPYEPTETRQHLDTKDVKEIAETCASVLSNVLR
ncbi:hypothetical protein I6E74_10060 [Salinibacterium sp. SWN139]|uniref:hypothetical protein n=1 Tax=Salinibacterium sp. SWN139 TaxID=2792055 RepID=UPI0018CECFE2|nr:hypothetical protein [Salinibacterium sp. SWN139]MBH0054508.1 hypothetical protein [Salinibacterium sp. SWN139]